MKKTLLSLLLLFTLTSLFADKVKRDKTDPWQNLKIGDKFTISKTTTDTETTFDFTGLGINDSMADKIGLSITYYKYNTTDLDNNYSLSILKEKIESNNFKWLFVYTNYAKSDEIENITSNYFKQTIKHSSDNREVLTAPTARTSILLYYYPKGRKYYNHCYIYLLKAMNDGNGVVEVVGYTILTPDANTSKGDMVIGYPIID